jgi:hypothetical protein
MYLVKHVSYCGMTGVPEAQESLRDARRECARRLRSYRRRFKVATLEPGAQWEILEPEDSAMVPDACGTLSIKRVTFECRECGSQCDTREIAYECCHPSEIYCEEGE